MAQVFKEFSKDENLLLIEAVPMIAVLIAGADNDIDIKEMTWAEKIVKIRSYHNHFDLKPYYKEVDAVFMDVFSKLIKELPADAESRNKILSDRLGKLNGILKKLNIRTAGQIYNSFLAYAEQIARSSGGIFRLMSVSKEESFWVGLPMLDPIFFDEFEEEE